MLEKILLDDSWDDIDDVNVCAEAFTLVMRHILDTGIMIPLKKMRVKRTCSPWIHDADITVVWHQRDWLHRKALKSGIPEDCSRYRKCCNKVTTLTRSAKQRYLSTLASNLSNDSCKFWRNFKHLSARQKVQGGALDVDVESINQHFLTIAHKTTDDLPFCPPLHYLIFLFSDVPCSYDVS